MKTITTPVTFATLYGPLYIAVEQADPYSYHDTERGNVTDLRPMLRVASDPAFEADPDAADHWTIRGRAYAVHYKVFFEDRTHIEYANGYREGRWHRDGYVPFGGGFRNDRRGPVDRHTKTFNLMWEETVRALDTFDVQTPGWMDLSRYLYHRGMQASEEGKAAALRAEAEGHDARALKAGSEAAKLAVALPPAVLDLVPLTDDPTE
jgi:hypothetical protein